MRLPVTVRTLLAGTTDGPGPMTLPGDLLGTTAGPRVEEIERLGTADRAEGRWLAFRALTPDHHPALRDGRLLLA